MQTTRSLERESNRQWANSCLQFLSCSQKETMLRENSHVYIGSVTTKERAAKHQKLANTKPLAESQATLKPTI